MGAERYEIYPETTAAHLTALAKKPVSESN